MTDFRDKANNRFNDAVIRELASILGLTDADAIEAFRADLVNLCAHYCEIIATLPCDLPDAPFNLSLTERADWLDTNVLKPAMRLRDALGDQSKPMFSTWPYPLDPPRFRDNAPLIDQLSKVIDEAESLRESLRGQQADDAGHSQELRQEIFGSLARCFRQHAPSVPPNRGVYDPERRLRYGRYVDAMRLAFYKIAGVEENLDRLIRGEMDFPS